MDAIKLDGFRGACRWALTAGLVVLVCAGIGVQAAGKGDVLTNDMRTPMGVSAAPKNNAPKAQHTKKHADIDKALAQQEVRCYQQFAVNSCLSEARAQARMERAAVDADEAKEKAAARYEASQAHQAERAQRMADHDTARASAANHPDSRKDASERPPPKPAKSAATADVQRIRQERAAAQSQRDERAVRARTRQAEKRAAAQQHQASMEQRKKDRQAQGGAQPAPLPAPP